MRLPIEGAEWPLQENLEWFSRHSSKEIVTSSDEKFMKQLKHNSLKLVTKSNKLFHDKVNAWHHMRPFKDCFGTFFKSIIRLALSNSAEFDVSIEDRYQILTFFNYAFNSIEVDFVNQQIKKYLPLSIWTNLSTTRREAELEKLSKKIQTAWSKLEQQDKKMTPDTLQERTFERRFIFEYIKQFLRILPDAVIDSSEDEMDTDSDPKLEKDVVLYCQRFLEFIIDLESQLPLRRFLHPLLDYSHLIVRCQLSSLARHPSSEGHLFDQLIELLQLYTRYDIDIMTGEPLTDVEIVKKHEQEIMDLQKLFWFKYDHLRKFAIKPVKAIDNPSALYKIITSFDSKDELFELLESLGLADMDSLTEEDRDDAPLMASILMNRFRRFESQIKKINSIPLFPNESVIWDTNLVPDEYYNYDYPLALPKLNLQFLTMSDYLLRNFMLFKNESTYEIRQDIEEGVRSSKIRWTPDGQFATGPKQRMALIIKDFSILEVGKPRLGESCPSKVRAKVVINMDYVKPEWRREWEQLRKHDTCFLVSFKKPSELDELGWPEGTFPQKYGIKYVRGCEIEGLLDTEGKIVEEHIDRPKFTTNLRTFLLFMDCNQYKIDQDTYKDRKTIVYNKFHMIVRRKPEKNNFKGVLETIRDLINTKFVVPHWLRDLLIGFGDPRDAHYTTLRSQSQDVELDYFDTFLNSDHITTTFNAIRPDYDINMNTDLISQSPLIRVIMNDQEKRIQVKPYELQSRGPYPVVAARKNVIKFTPAQVEAITSGLQPGLTMVVGPPGTGKTDVAVQILNTLYHSHPEQRTLIVTHSNQALNQIFRKMVELDVKEHHLLRLGHGEEELDSEKDFSRQGRIKHVLLSRTQLLERANELAKSMGLDPARGMTCQSAQYFFSYHIQTRWRGYLESVSNLTDPKPISEQFPFSKYFEDAPQPLFPGNSIGEDLEIAKGCFRYIEDIFDQLQAFRPFEIFSSAADRSQYLMIREAKIIAMTCTHAGLRRKELVELNFQYDNILMEETAQILEVETAIPLLLQNPENGVNRLKRWIMIGDHNQLPPIIQNSAFQKFSNMEQSLFARFIRIGVPAVELDAQGRSRPSICDLYRWRYSNLGELEHVQQAPEYKLANAGFAYEYQMVNVNDYNGLGETAPRPFFYQNKGEAEYVLAVFKYMQLLGYPADKITILTTYNGQKELLRQMIDSECAKNTELNRPSKITTVDKFQGQQNDYILLSLVRTRAIGHIRDVRRLVVAMSRARLGLYVFCRVSVFKQSLELQHAMNLFLKHPTEGICLFNGEETFPSSRSAESRKHEQDPCGQVDLVCSLEQLQQIVELGGVHKRSMH